MINNLRRIFALIVFTVASIAPLGLQAEVSRERFLGRKVADVELTDAATGETWQLTDQDARAYVLYFLSTECPVTNRYLPTLNRVHSDLADNDVIVVALNSNQHDSLEEIRTHADDYELTFPVLQDPHGTVARSLAVTRTAEAFVLDHEFKVRYRGVIDNRFERGVTRPKATQTYLSDALNAVLNRRTVKTPVTDVEACPLNLAEANDPHPLTPVVTYSQHVAPIIQRRCQACHRPDAIGPFELMTYDDATSWAESIREVVTSGLMPPWHAEAPHGHFLNDRSLTEKEYSTLLDWIDDGLVEGDKTNLPKPRDFPATWSIGTPDWVASMEKSIEIPAETPELGIPYKYIWAGEPFEREVWVKAAEVLPGANDVVHHASVYIVPRGVTIELENDQRPASVSELQSPINNLPHLVSFVPGDNAFVHREGNAVRIPQGARLLFEMHYTPTGKKAIDRTQVGLQFADEPPINQVYSTAAINYWFSIPPGEADYQAKARMARFGRDTILLAMNPHMHYRGKSFKYELVERSGKRTLLLNVPNYNFEWQSTYWLKDPVLLPQGTWIECTATFDNSEDNPFNPDPTARVTWGEQTWQEMMLGSIEVYEKE